MGLKALEAGGNAVIGSVLYIVYDVCACMYVYMYVYICMYVCMHACMYVYMHVCMYICTYVYMYIRIYVCMYVCTIDRENFAVKIISQLRPTAKI